MKSVENVRANLNAFKNKFGIEVADAQQQSAAWFILKQGVVSASCAAKFVATKTSATRNGYIAELVAQVATGLMPEISAAPLAWGNDHEDAARSHYEFSSGLEITELPFVFKDETFRFGCSPDGLVTDKKGVEIKCPFNSRNYIEFLTAKKVKPEWDWQVQFTMWVTGAEEWDFVQYDPRMRKNLMRIITIEKSEEKFEKLDGAAEDFIKDMDEMLARAGFEFGEHWAKSNGGSNVIA